MHWPKCIHWHVFQREELAAHQGIHDIHHPLMPSRNVWQSPSSLSTSMPANKHRKDSFHEESKLWYEWHNLKILWYFSDCMSINIPSEMVCIFETGSFLCRFGLKALKVRLHDAIYRLRTRWFISYSHSSVASLQKNRGDKSHRVIVA